MGSLAPSKQQRLIVAYGLLTLGFVLFASSALTLATKVVLNLSGKHTEAYILKKYPTDHFIRIRYTAVDEKIHELDLQIPPTIHRRIAAETTIPIVYNPRFPDYSIKLTETVQSSSWRMDIILTAAGLILLGGGVYFARRNYINLP